MNQELMNRWGCLNGATAKLRFSNLRIPPRPFYTRAFYAQSAPAPSHRTPPPPAVECAGRNRPQPARQQRTIPPCPHGLYTIWKQIIAILKRQKHDPTYQYVPDLPPQRSRRGVAT